MTLKKSKDNKLALESDLVPWPDKVRVKGANANGVPLENDSDH